MEGTNRSIVNAFGAIVIITILGIAVLNFLNIRFPISITTSSRSDELAVVGEGKVEVTPDTAFADVGITVTDARTVDEAQSKINKVNNEIIDTMKQLGIPKENIKTSNYSIYPNMAYDGGKSRTTGYNGNATISIKTEKLNLVSQILQKATEAGANQVQGSRFSVEKPEQFREQAREKAIQNAREQAEKLAKSLGIKLGRIVNIVESSPNDVYPIGGAMRSEAAGLGGGAPAAIEPGTQTISSTVTLYFEKH